MGEGPGEFSWPSGYAVMRDGTTVVSDVKHDALQLFDPSGTFMRMVRRPDELGMTSGTQRDPRGGAVLAESFAMSMGRGWTSRPLLRLSLAGDVVQFDTATEGWLPDRSVSAEASNVARSFGFGSITQPAVFEPELLFGVLPGRYRRTQRLVGLPPQADTTGRKRGGTRHHPAHQPAAGDAGGEGGVQEAAGRRVGSAASPGRAGRDQVDEPGVLRAPLLSRTPRHPGVVRDVGRASLGPAPGRRMGRRRTHRRADPGG